MKFTELLTEWLELRAKGPDESSGYSDKAYYRRVSWLEDAMDSLAPGDVVDTARPIVLAGALAEDGRTIAPWVDFEGNVLYLGDRIKHPSGETGIIEYDETRDNDAGRWRVRYDDAPAGETLALCNQIGAKGQAVKVPA